MVDVSCSDEIFYSDSDSESDACKNIKTVKCTNNKVIISSTVENKLTDQPFIETSDKVDATQFMKDTVSQEQYNILLKRVETLQTYIRMQDSQIKHLVYTNIQNNRVICGLQATIDMLLHPLDKLQVAEAGGGQRPDEERESSSQSSSTHSL